MPTRGPVCPPAEMGKDGVSCRQSGCTVDSPPQMTRFTRESSGSNSSNDSGHASSQEADYVGAAARKENKAGNGVLTPPPRPPVQFCDDDDSDMDTVGSTESLESALEYDRRIRDIFELLDIDIESLGEQTESHPMAAPSKTLARDLFAQACSLENITPATLIPALQYAPYSASLEAENRHRNPLLQEAYLIRTGQVHLIVSLDEVWQGLLRAGACNSEHQALRLVDRLFSVQNQLRLNAEVVLENRRTSIQTDLELPPYCFALLYDEELKASSPPVSDSHAWPNGETTMDKNGGDAMDAGHEDSGQAATSGSDECTRCQIKESGKGEAQHPKATLVREVAQIMMNGIRGVLPSPIPNTAHAASGAGSPQTSRARLGGLATIDELPAADNEGDSCPNAMQRPSCQITVQRKVSAWSAQPSIDVSKPKAKRLWSTCNQPNVRRARASSWHVVKQASGEPVLSQPGLSTAQRHQAKSGQVMFNMPTQYAEDKLSLRYTEHTGVKLTVQLLSFSGDSGAVKVSIVNRRTSGSAFFCLRFFAHHWPMHVQIVFPLMSGVEELRAEEHWEKRVEVHGVEEDSWCSFELFSAASRPEPVWGMQRVSVKMTMTKSCLQSVDKDDAISALVCAIFSAVHADFTTATHREVERMVFGSFRLEVFQRPSLQAFLCAVLAVVQTRRGDPRGSLVLCTNVYKLRQMVTSSAHEPNVWALVDVLMSSVEKAEHASPPPSPPAHGAPVNENTGTATAEYLSEPEKQYSCQDESNSPATQAEKILDLESMYSAEEQTIKATVLGGVATFGEEDQLTVHLVVESQACQAFNVSVMVYDQNDLALRFAAIGISSIGRPLLLAELRILEDNAQACQLQSMTINGKIPSSVCDATDRARLGLKPRLMVFRESAAQWVDVSNRVQHAVKIRKNNTFSITCPFYPRIALMLVSSFIESLSYSLLDALTVPLAIGNAQPPVLFRVYMNLDRLCHGLHRMLLTCEDAQAKPQDGLAGESMAVQLPRGTLVRFYANGNIAPCSEFGEEDLSTTAVRFPGKQQEDEEQRKTCYMTREKWVVVVVRQGEEQPCPIRGRVLVHAGEAERSGALLADFAISWPRLG
ncbi:uncharacterized protein LOC135818236 isoform X1 [Sycon ciliatum]|uniref:uncharacterized protein LOC135818236 isoform X1 n=2 Tax=Sycon ciliatum TaxID=27933 RepID=UPI0031F6E8E2